MREPASILVLAILGAPGCTEWPRLAHLDEGPAVYGPVLEAAVENEEIGNGNQLQNIVLDAVHTGIDLRGNLDGFGAYEVEDCDGDRVLYSAATATGDADLDIFRVEIGAEGVLCGGATLDVELQDGEDFGIWDFVLFQEQDCGNEQLRPVNPQPAGESGVPDAFPKAEGHWAVPVIPGRYLVLIGGYDPLDAAPSYTFGLALRPTGDVLDDCPKLPREGSSPE